MEKEWMCALKASVDSFEEKFNLNGISEIVKELNENVSKRDKIEAELEQETKYIVEDLERSDNEMELYVNKLNDANLAIGNIEKENTKLKWKEKIKEEEIENAKNEIVDLKSLLEESRCNRVLLEEKNKFLEDKVADQKVEIQSKLHENNDIQLQLDELSEKISSLYERHEIAIRLKNEELENANLSHSSTISSLKTRLDTSIKSMAELRSENSELKTKSSEIMDTFKIQQLQQTSIMKKMEDEITQYKNTIKSLEKENSVLNKYNEENNLAINSLEKKVKTQKNVISDLHKQLTNMKGYMQQAAVGGIASNGKKSDLMQMVLQEMDKLGSSVQGL